VFSPIIRQKIYHTSFRRRTSSSSVCGGAYFAEMQWRVLAVRLASGSASARGRASCCFFTFCPCMRRCGTQHRYTRHALKPCRPSASVRHASARSSSQMRSPVPRGLRRLPWAPWPLPLLFPFRIGAAVGDAISTSCGDIGDVPFLAIAFCKGGSSPFVG